METPYACYLRLPELLELQQPRTAAERSAQWADEHFFITVHQAAEVLVSQALVDVERAAQQARAGRQRGAAAALRRVTAVISLLEEHLTLLEHLDPGSFASFRPLLDNASGAQSHQIIELFDRITTPGGVLVHSTEPEAATASGTESQDWRELADAWWAVRAAVTRWQTRHLLLVERMIGDQDGTGGTSGLAYLRSRIDLPPRHTG